MKEEQYVEYIADNNPRAKIFDNLDSCIVGYKGDCEEMVAVYDYKLIIESYMADGMSEEEAMEFYSYNLERTIPYM